MSESNDEKEFYKLNPFIAEIRLKLKNLPKGHQVAFAAYCSERLFKYYVELAKVLKTNDDIPVLRNVLNCVWNYSINQSKKQEELNELLEQINQVALGDEACCEEWEAAVDAVGTIWLAVEACIGNSDNKSAYAASKVLDRVDQRLMNEIVGFNSFTAAEYPGIKKQIEESSLMNDTKQQLIQTISFLRNQPDLDEVDIRNIRTRAETSI
jgi:uncharacterized protein YjaG (DUF416 family)